MSTVLEVHEKMSSGEFGPNDVFYFYKGNGEHYRWRRVAPNGEIVGASTEGYQNEDMCTKNAIRNGMSKGHRYEVE